MGTIYIEEYAETGGSNHPNSMPVYKNLVNATKDATTSTTAESVTTNGSASLIRVYAVEDHRVCVGGNETADAGDYTFVPAGTSIDLGLHKGGDVVYYRSDA